MGKLIITSEYSAQGMHSKANPLVQSTLNLLTTNKQFRLKSNLKIVDMGCGKLRHLNFFTQYAKNIVLVDTAWQIERVQKFGDMTCTMSQYIETLKNKNCKFEIHKIDDFEVQNHCADIVVSTAVMDVVLKKARKQIASAAYQNLRPGGYFVVIVPRNDSSILVRCKQENKYQDGFVFKNRGNNIRTFYTNYRDHSKLIKLLANSGFTLIDDLSVYRQVCVILQKPI